MAIQAKLQFSLNYTDIFCHTTLKCLRRDVGLGNPPNIFTINASESLNAAMKKKITTKKWNGLSPMKLSKRLFLKMTPDQRKAFVQKFASTKIIKSTTISVLSSEPDLPCCSHSYQKGDSSRSRFDSASQK